MSREYLQISIPEYHERPEVSSGMIRSFRKDGPWLCYHRYVLRDYEDPDSKEKRLGRAFHVAMSEPDRFDECVEVMREQVGGERFNARKPAHRAFRAERELWCKSNGKEFVTSEEREQLRQMVASVYDNPATTPYVGQSGQVELACISNDPETELGLKALADLYLGETIVDFKTTRHATVDDFVADALRRGYLFQAAHYLAVFGAERFVVVAVRNQPPWESMVYKVSGHRLREAVDSNKAVLRDIKQCYQAGSWHTLGWGQEIELDYEDTAQVKMSA